MRTIQTACSLLVPVIAATGTLADQCRGEKLQTGFWAGKLNALPVILYVKKDSKKVAKWHFDSPFEGIKGIAATSSKFDARARTLTIQFGTVGSSFIGTLNKDGSEIKGNWKTVGGAAPLTFKHSKEMPFRRPQTPKPPFPYRSENVTYKNKKANIKLAGTLTWPKGKGPFPAVILSTGSGANNRDSEFYAHKPFLLIADYLTRRGIAVLRVDDRGVGGSTGNRTSSTTADFAEDVLAGVAFLKGRKDIDGARIGQIGHSEGAIIGPVAAVQSKDIAFLVLLAGMGCTGAETNYQQTTFSFKQVGAPKEALDYHLKCLAKLFDLSNKEKKAKLVEKRFYETLAEWKKKATAIEKLDIDWWKGPVGKREVHRMLQPWHRYFLRLDPLPVLRKVQCPVLALHGEKDMQTQYQLHLPAISKALHAGGNEDVTTRSFPKLNHVFQTCKTGLATEYGTIEETMAPVVLETMTKWIRMRVGLKKSE